MDKIPAYILGGGTNGLAVVRNLGRMSVPVYCVVEKNDRAIYSKFCKKTFVVPQIEKKLEVLNSFFNVAERRKKGGVLFSTSDSYTLQLSKSRDELENYYFVPSPTHETARILVNKKEFYKSLQTFNIPHPNTYFPESLVDLRRIEPKIRYPIFVKPAISEDFYGTFYRKGFLANNKRELFCYCSLAWKNDLEIVLQQIISGIDARNVYCIESYLDRSSNSKGVFVSLRVRGWPPVFGNTCLRESISPLEITEQLSITLSYLKSIRYHGLMEAEWKRDITDGTFKLLEINARQSMQNSLPSRCGMNLMLIAYLDKIHRERGSVSVYNQGVKWCDLFSDLQSALKTHVSFKDWISTLKNPIEWSNFATDDSWPWFISLFETIRSTIKKTYGSFNNLSK